MTDSDRLIGEILIEMGYASRDLVAECLRAQTEIHRRGQSPVPLGKLLVRTGCLTTEQLEKALAKQRRYRLPN